MRFVAGRGAEAERMAGSAMAKRMAALWQRAIGKILLAGAPWETMGAIEDRGRRGKPCAPSKTISTVGNHGRRGRAWTPIPSGRESSPKGTMT